MELGDKVYQILYDWGKKPDGSFYLYEVKKISKDNHATGGGKGLDCYNHETNSTSLYIPENTWIKVSDYRIKRLNNLI